MRDPLQIKIIEQEDDDDESDEEEDVKSDGDEESPKGTPKGTPEPQMPDGFARLTLHADGRAPDGAKASEAWDIPAPKHKERLPLPNAPAAAGEARSAPELQRLAPEDDDGHIEYKVRGRSYMVMPSCAYNSVQLKLVNISDERFEHLLSQMQWRLSEGQGKAIYRLGVTDSGEQVGLPVVELDASIETVKKMATQLKADVHIVSRKAGLQGETAELLVEKRYAARSLPYF